MPIWPDLANIHQSESVQNKVTSNSIDFVQKKRNLPNVPQARPIELFWALCKQEYRQLSEKPKNFPSFKNIWCKMNKSVANKHAQALMKNVRKTLKQIGDNGLFALFKDTKRKTK